MIIAYRIASRRYFKLITFTTFFVTSTTLFFLVVFLLFFFCNVNAASPYALHRRRRCRTAKADLSTKTNSTFAISLFLASFFSVLFFFFYFFFFRYYFPTS